MFYVDSFFESDLGIELVNETSFAINSLHLKSTS